MKRNLAQSSVACLLIIFLLIGCGSGSDSDSAATNVVTKDVGQTDELSTEAVIVADSTDEVVPTSTLYADGQPTPTAIAGAKCSYLSTTSLDFQIFDEMRSELHVCNEDFVWPQGYEVDIERYAFSGDTVGGWEVGSARMNIAWFNSCAWMAYWMESTQAGDLELADKTFQYMTNTIPYWGTPGPPNLANADPMFKDMLDKAALGDLGPIRSWLNAGDCMLYQEMRLNP